MRTIDSKRQHPEISVVPTASGMIAGAIAGAIAGPPGIAIGATVGGVAGALAGEALEAATDELELRDEELDERIGVASGDMGAHDVAAAALGAEERSTRDDLLGEHAAIEKDLERFRNELRCTDSRGLVAHFARFEDRLRSHLRYEEAELFPVYAAARPREAEELLAEHSLLRKKLDDLAIAIELHTASATEIASLLEALSVHQTNEERLFYQWACR